LVEVAQPQSPEFTKPFSEKSPTPKNALIVSTATTPSVRPAAGFFTIPKVQIGAHAPEGATQKTRGLMAATSLMERVGSELNPTVTP